MLGKIFGVLAILSAITAIFTGNMSEVGIAAINGAGEAVKLTLALAGIMCLWSGVMGVAKKAGLIEKLSAAMLPLLRLLFPDAYRAKKSGNADADAALGSMSLNMGANMLGLSNASTPIAITAMQKLKTLNNDDNTASKDMVMFAVFNCASIQIIPTTLIALRSAAGSANPFEILAPVWICSFITAVMAVILVKLLNSGSKQ